MHVTKLGALFCNKILQIVIIKWPQQFPYDSKTKLWGSIACFAFNLKKKREILQFGTKTISAPEAIGHQAQTGRRETSVQPKGENSVQLHEPGTPGWWPFPL